VQTYQARALDALGDPTRRQVFELLGAGTRSVGQLAELLPVSRPAVSQHLKALRDAGLVTVRAEGTRRLYSLDAGGIAAVRGYFDDFWTQALLAFRHAAEGNSPDHPQEEQ
jgi:DNA-binding transcriptional ArsR family regulator